MSYIVEIGPFNGPDDSDASMAWVDITGYVNDNLMPGTAASGRQTELESVNPGQFSVILNDPDHRFTAGYTGGPYGSGFKTGMRVRLRETISYRSFTLFDGNMLQPDLKIQTAGIDQTVTLNATDRIGRLQNGRKFISTLAEYIMFNGGSSLKAYWPCNEGRSPLRNQLSSLANLTVIRNDSTLGASLGGSPVVGYQQGTNPAGDDSHGLLLTPTTTPFGNINAKARASMLYCQRSSNTSGDAAHPLMHAGDTLTMLCWVNLDPSFQDYQDIFDISISDVATKSVISQLGVNRNSKLNTVSRPGLWQADLFTGSTGLVGTINGPALDGGGVMLIGVQFGYSPNVFSLWLDGVAYSTTPTGTLTDPQYIGGNVSWGSIGFSGSISHIQLYVGTYTFAQYLAQRQAGISGLGSQYTGQRFQTIAQYAGVASGDIMADPGTVRMQNIGLAGQDPLTVLQDAVTTEQGRMRVAGRKLIFEDDTRGYNR